MLDVLVVPYVADSADKDVRQLEQRGLRNVCVLNQEIWPMMAPMVLYRSVIQGIGQRAQIILSITPPVDAPENPWFHVTLHMRKHRLVDKLIESSF